jgi:hypothetical protein
MSRSATLSSGSVICLVLCGRKSGVRGDRGEGVPCTVRYQIIYILSLSDRAGEGRRYRGGGQPLGRIQQRPQSSE